MMTTRVLAALAVFVSVCWSMEAGAGLRNEPHGWDSMRWGTPVEAAIKGNKDWKTQFKLNEIKKVLETRDVILTGLTELSGRSAKAQWIFGQEGLHTVVLTWEDSRAEAYLAHQEVIQGLEDHWGEADQVAGDTQTWSGEWTKAEVKRLRVATGSGVEVRLTALPGAFEGGPDGPNPSMKSKAKVKVEDRVEVDRGAPKVEERKKEPIIEKLDDDFLGLD